MIITIIFCTLAFGLGYLMGRIHKSSNTIDQKTVVQVRLKALSTNINEIENFLIQFSGYDKLDQESINLLVTRIEELKADKVISNDTASELLLKQRIDILNPVEEITVEEEKPAKKTRKKR